MRFSGECGARNKRIAWAQEISGMGKAEGAFLVPHLLLFLEKGRSVGEGKDSEGFVQSREFTTAFALCEVSTQHGYTYGSDSAALQIR